MAIRGTDASPAIKPAPIDKISTLLRRFLVPVSRRLLKMKGSRHLLLLGLGLCLVASYVDSAAVKVYGNDPNNPYQDVTRELEKQRADKHKLEALLEQTANAQQKSRLQKDLDKINSAIAKMEVTFRVLYRDHIEAVKNKTEDLENEKAKMQNQLKEAEEQHAKAIANMESANQKDRQQVSAYQAKLEESTKQMEKIQREYEALKELQAEKEEREKEEKEKLINIKSELTKKLEEAQRLHSKAIEVMSMSLEAPNGKPVSIPLQSDIEQWKKSVVALSSVKNTDKKLEGLMKVQNALKSLHDKLYEKSELSTTTPHGELQKALAIMKQNTKISKTEQINKRNELMNNFKKTALGDYNEEEIDELRKVNENIQASEIFLKEIDRRKAYLKSIKEIDALMKQCKALAKIA